MDNDSFTMNDIKGSNSGRQFNSSFVGIGSRSQNFLDMLFMTDVNSSSETGEKLVNCNVLVSVITSLESSKFFLSRLIPCDAID